MNLPGTLLWNVTCFFFDIDLYLEMCRATCFPLNNSTKRLVKNIVMARRQIDVPERRSVADDISSIESILLSVLIVVGRLVFVSFSNLSVDVVYFDRILSSSP
jgi:hypothetical protein